MPKRKASAKHRAIQSPAESKTVSMLIYGLPGVGKTRFIGSGDQKTLILRPPTDHLDSIEDTSNIEEWVMDDWAAMLEAQTYLQQEGGAGYEWVWLDSISLFQDHGLDDIWADVLARKPDRARYGLDKPEYGTNMHRLGQWVRHMVGNPDFNFGITAHPTLITVENYESGELETHDLWMPYVQGKNMPEKVCGYMNLVAYYQIVRTKKGKRQEERRVLRTKATPGYYAKDQFDALPEGRMVDPTMPQLTAAIDKVRKKRSGAPARKTKAPAKRRATRRK